MTRDAFLSAMGQGYRDRFGFPASRQGQLDPAGNCLMFLAEEMIILHDLNGGDWIGEDWDRLWNLVDLCALELGNLRRTPKGCTFASDQEGWDDFLGLTAAAALIDQPQPSNAACVVIKFGRSHFFSWGPFLFPYAFVTANPAPFETKDANPWLGRYLQFVAHLRWCAGETPNWAQRFVWFFSVAAAGWDEPHGQDPWRLTYLMLRAQKIRRRWWHWPEHLAELIWRFRIKLYWPGGIRDVRARYFNDPNHPLAVFASMEF